MPKDEDYATRTVVKRDAVNQAMVDAAKVMPGTADPEMSSDPAETPAATEANGPVTGRPGIPGKLPGTTRG